MKTSDLLVDVFLVLGVGCQLVCCVGVVAMRSVFDRLHFAGAGNTLGPLFVGAAVLVRQTTSSAGIETVVTMALIVLIGPLVTLATVRAARRDELGQIGPTDGELRQLS
jgi:monovalent cation/proton antiporter MnhG/PhaG subunit